MNDYSINAVITLDTSDYKKGISEAQKSTKTFSSNFSKLTKGLGGALLKGGAIGLGITAVTKGLQALSKTVKESIKVWEDASAQQKKLGQTLKATGADAWTTAEELNAMADAYQKATNYSSDEITKMQTVLLGFKNVSQDTFQSASDAILDMAEVMGMDLVSATQTVGKALDDPINGLGSLSRQGFKFSEAEKELIKNLVEAGESAKAQKIILDELNTTYGGASKAGVKASIQLKNAWEDVVKELGRGITLNIDVGPAIQKLQKLIDDFKRVMQENNDATELTDKLIEAEKAIEQKTATDEQVILVYENKIKLMEQEYRQYEGLLGIEDEYAREGIARLDEEKKHYEWQIENAKKRIELYEYLNQKAEERENKAIEEENYEANIAKIKQEHLDKIAEQVAQWERIKQVTGEEVNLEEKIKFYQDDLVSILQEANGGITKQNQYYKDQIAIIQKLQSELKPEESDTWTKKIREQAISRLEAEKEEMAQRLELTGYTEEQKVEILQKYNAKLFELNRERIIAEREEAIKSVEDFANAEEEKERIMEYYQNLLIENAKKYPQEYKKAGEKSATSFAEGFKNVVKKLEPTLKQIGKALQSIGKIAKSMFQGGKSIFTKLFNIDTNAVLDSILKIEDKILTFFVETVPKLPQFVASAMQSISVLLTSVLQVVTPEKVTELIVGIMNTIAEYAPVIIQTIADVMTNMLDGLINSMPEILKTLNVIVGKIAEVLPKLIEKLIQAFIAILQNPEEIASLVVALIKGFVEIINVLIRNLAPLLKALLPAIGTIILELIKAIPELLVSMAESIGEALKEIGKYIVNLLIDILNKMLDGISKAWTWTGAKGIPHIKHLATGTQNAKRGLTLVGEAGPELVNFRGGEQVLNNRNTQKALAGIGNNGNTFNVTFNNTMDTTAYAMMSQLRQYNRQMAINGVI